jgi:anti-anti-sigma factor
MAMQTVCQLEIYQRGPLSVIGFGTRYTLNPFDLAECRDEVFDLIREERCEMLAIDLTGIRVIPSGLLGLLVSVHQQDVKVCLFNPSEDLREVLKITKLDQLFPAYRVEL